MDQITIVGGSTSPIKFQLLEQGQPIDVTGVTVTLLLTARDGSSVSTSGKVTVVNTSNGEVNFTPGSSDLTDTLSPYLARWVLTDGNGAVSYVPSGYRDEWDVVVA